MLMFDGFIPGNDQLNIYNVHTPCRTYCHEYDKIEKCLLVVKFYAYCNDLTDRNKILLLIYARSVVRRYQFHAAIYI